MKVELLFFQKKAVNDLIKFAARAKKFFDEDKKTQIISFTAPTGSGKTIMSAAFVEEIYSAQDDAIFIWLSDFMQTAWKIRNLLQSRKNLSTNEFWTTAKFIFSIRKNWVKAVTLQNILNPANSQFGKL